MSEPVAHPLVKLLGDDWLFLDRPEAATVVVLHRDGAWFEFTGLTGCFAKQPNPWPATWAILADAMRCAGPGRNVLEVGKTGDRPYARALRR